MRGRTLLVVALGLAVLPAGCGKRSAGTGGGWVEGGKKGKSGVSGERSMPANAEELKQAMANYLARPEVRVKEPRFYAIAEPFPVKLSDGTAQGYWVQFTATDSLGNKMLRNHDLFLVRNGQVIAWYRTKEELIDRFGPRWSDEHRPPPWPDVVTAEPKKPAE